MKYILKLYVLGETANSARAIKNLKKIAKEFLDERYIVEIIDIIKTPELVANERLIAIPTLIKHFPPPVYKIIGDLSDTERVLFTLGLKRTIEKITGSREENHDE